MPSPLPLQPVLNFSALLGSEAGKRVTWSPKRIGHPDPVLLVDAEVERPEEGLAGLDLAPLANDPPLGQIALGEVDELALRDAHGPDVAARA